MSEDCVFGADDHLSNMPAKNPGQGFPFRYREALRGVEMRFDQFAHSTNRLNPDLTQRHLIGLVLGVVGSFFVPSSPSKGPSCVLDVARQKINVEIAPLENRLPDRDSDVEGER